MKKLLFTMAALLLLALPSSAMSYEQARQQALFLTDKMAYELNLSEAQYEAAYEINLDYLMSINTVDDLAGNYWRWRNLDMSYVLPWVAVSRLLRRRLLLPPALLGHRMLALRHLRPLSPPRLLLFRPPHLLRRLSWRPLP